MSQARDEFYKRYPLRGHEGGIKPLASQVKLYVDYYKSHEPRQRAIDELMKHACALRESTEALFLSTAASDWSGDIQLLLRYSIAELVGAAATNEGGVFAAMVENVDTATLFVRSRLAEPSNELMALESAVSAAKAIVATPKMAGQNMGFADIFRAPATRLATRYSFDDIRTMNVRQANNTIFRVTLQ